MISLTEGCHGFPKGVFKIMNLRSAKDMKNIFGNPFRLITVALMMVLLVGTVAPAAQLTSQRQTKQRPKLTVAQRLAKAAARSQGENVILPIFMHALERYASGRSPETVFDRAVADAFSKRPSITKEMIGTAINNYKALPSDLKAKLIPAELRNLSPAQKLDVKSLEPVMRRLLKKRSAAISTTPVRKGGTLELGKANNDKKGVSSPKPQPKLKLSITLKSVAPDARYPGSKTTIKGLFPSTADVVLESKDQEGQDFVLKKSNPKAGVKWINVQQIDLTVPQFVPPGKYRLGVRIPNGTTTNQVNFEVKAPQYRVRFTKIKCLDEQDPEWPGDDEIVTIWGVNADPNYTWVKRTDQYEDFEDNVEKSYKPQHQWIFRPDSQQQAVRKALAITTTLWEWDASDVAEANDLLDAVGDGAAEIGSAIGGAYGGIIGGIVDVVLDVIGAIVSAFGGDPDFLGTKKLVWSAAQLQELTAGKQQVNRTLNFLNSDDDGSYRLYYTIYRDQPN